MKAVIMAGGKGTRLRPLTCFMPKPMVPLLDRPCMEYIIDLLKKHGITEIAVTVQFLPQVIRNYFGDGTDFGVRLHFFEEREPLGTAGSVKNAEEFLDETFLVISGDSMTDFDLTKAIEFHREKRALTTIVMTKVEVPLEYGVVMTTEDGRVSRFLEKPSWSEVFSDTVNTGIYVVEPEALQLFDKEREYDFSKDLFPQIMAQGLPLYGYVADGYWSDIGNLNQYRQTQFDMLMGLVDAHIKGKELYPRVWVGEDAVIEPGAQVQGPSFIGTGSMIGSGAKIGPYAVVGRYNHLDSKATMERTAIWNRNHIGRSTALTGATLCSGITVGSGVEIGESAVVGDKCQIGDNAVIRPNVKVWPEKEIGYGTIQQSSLIWGRSVFNSLFDEEGISGVPNVEVVPELAGRVAAAYASCLRTGTTVIVSSDDYPYCGILKYAMIASLMASGLKVRDAGIIPVPVARYEVRRSGSEGGIHVRSNGEGEDRSVVLQFFDREGLPIDKGAERKVENAFFQEDYTRPDASRAGTFEQTPDIAKYYMWEVLSRVRVERVRASKLHVVLHCESAHVQSVMQPMLEHLGCQVISVSRPERRLGDIVVATGAHVGIELDTSGQKFLFYSETGYCLTKDEVLILQMLAAIKEQGTAAVPVTAPSIAEEMSGQVPVVRTKTVLRSVLEVGSDNPLQVYFDGFYSVASLLQFLAEEGMTLQGIIDQLPQFHMMTEVVPCPSQAKGRVMRRLMEETKGQQLELIDGIKVLTDDGWALIMPDADKAMFKVVAQGSSEDTAMQIMEQYKNRIYEYKQA